MCFRQPSLLPLVAAAGWVLFCISSCAEGSPADGAAMAAGGHPANGASSRAVAVTSSALEAPPEVCVSTSATDTTCDGVDNNCNGAVDEGCVAMLLLGGAIWQDDFEAARTPSTDLNPGFDLLIGLPLRYSAVVHGGNWSAQFGFDRNAPGELRKRLDTTGYASVTLSYFRLLALDTEDRWVVRYSTDGPDGPWTELESASGNPATWEQRRYSLPSVSELWLSFGVTFNGPYNYEWALLDDIAVIGEETCAASGDCDDGLPCTSDTCGPASSCEHATAPAGASCSGPSTAGVCSSTSECVACQQDGDCPERDGVGCTAPKCIDERCYEETTTACTLAWGRSCSLAATKIVPANVVTGPPEGRGAGFGTSVDVSGNLMVVSAPYDAEVGTDEGAVFVYEYQGTTWQPITKLVQSNAVPGTGPVGTPGNFGYAQVDGDWIFASAPGRDGPDGTYNVGAISMYQRTSSNNWIETPLAVPAAGSVRFLTSGPLAYPWAVVLASWDDPTDHPRGDGVGSYERCGFCLPPRERPVVTV